MHAAKQIILALVVIVIAVSLFNVAVTIPHLLNPVHVIGDITYQPIDELPEREFAITLTDKDFEEHPAFSLIFDEENMRHMVFLVSDVNREENPKPNTSSSEGHWLYSEFPYVEYNGQLYQCVLTLA